MRQTQRSPEGPRHLHRRSLAGYTGHGVAESQTGLRDFHIIAQRLFNGQVSPALKALDSVPVPRPALLRRTPHTPSPGHGGGVPALEGGAPASRASAPFLPRSPPPPDFPLLPLHPPSPSPAPSPRSGRGPWQGLRPKPLNYAMVRVVHPLAAGSRAGSLPSREGTAPPGDRARGGLGARKGGAGSQGLKPLAGLR